MAVMAIDPNDFNPLPSCEGRRGNGGGSNTIQVQFQSTPLMRGETELRRTRGGERRPFQSTPLMRGETWKKRYLTLWMNHFNPLPSCEGRRGYIHAPF